jgi:hypothetical protein
MSTSTSVQDQNRQLARSINAQALQNPQSPYVDKWVGIANGQVVVVADTLDEMVRCLRQIEPDPSKTYGLAASEDPNEVHEI